MNEHPLGDALRWFSFTAASAKPGDLGACCAELHEAVTQRDSTSASMRMASFVSLWTLQQA